MLNSNGKILHSLEYVHGMNNVAVDIRLPIKISDLKQPIYDVRNLENVDINDQYLLTSRKGKVLRVAGTDIHSFWSNGEIGFYVDKNSLYCITSAGTTYYPVLLYTGLSTGMRMSYVAVNDKIYMTNGVYIGYYKDNELFSLSAPNVSYKLSLPAGQVIESYEARLFVAKDKIVYISDPLCDHFDIRTGFKTIKQNATMLKAVDDGIFVADTAVAFWEGNVDGLKRREVSPSPAFPNTAVGIKLSNNSDSNIVSIVIWTALDGIYIGENGGKITNVLEGRYSFPAGFSAQVAGIRLIDGTLHYLVSTI